ncbi:MAG: hypothetical protein COX77_03005 [Candidatus Komeilibacteria bacterium CG_4_10_14_0_2_um_filter_37_10]|uniref:Cell division protein FtsL n=1 Tax=Candidatus Komeilibacteria bacterium CG_4_10_14_0_2_um_filter_37_10 TaxID=1974470 RepID=A0A2M7VEI5_9BACT|nr:MAG: hypothetical protein COX77_03005 [Candidatus Komeilibacteria bacterium CG_4_10_14_0_2_um_filter_37_10]PJA92499.1 MAG: hypothetical protein CO133_02890 [Candidatus Komeilibacteria bacterium CG_4_9_14_3_um_filter_37_5]
MRGPKTNFKIVSFVQLRTFLVVFSVVALFGYLGIINNSSTLGIEYAKLQNEIQTLQATNNELKIQIGNHQSISRVEQLASQLNMVKVDQYTYLNSETAVAIVK